MYFFTIDSDQRINSCGCSQAERYGDNGITKLKGKSGRRLGSGNEHETSVGKWNCSTILFVCPI